VAFGRVQVDACAADVLSVPTMGNRVYLELRGSDLPILAEEDEEAVASLAANNSLPLFWLALLQEEHLGPAWESEVRAAFADPEEGGMEPIRLGWREARANLAAARAAAGLRLPSLFPLLRDWEAGLVALSEQGPAQEVRIYLAEHANFFASADAFIGRLREIVQLWHGSKAPAPPVVENVASELTGFVGLTDQPFPAALPTWEPGRPVPGVQASPVAAAGAPPPARRVGPAAEWGMVLLFSVTVVGSALLGARYLGSGGMWTGGVIGFLVAVMVVWRWARWSTSR
jgi:hypothetical protein